MAATGADPKGREAVSSERAVVLVVAVALIDVDGRVLLAERPAGKSMAGLWEFPGGKVHAGETPEAALIRELKEELAVTSMPSSSLSSRMSAANGRAASPRGKASVSPGCAPIASPTTPCRRPTSRSSPCSATSSSDGVGPADG